MTADEAVAVFWRAVEAGHFADLEARLREDLYERRFSATGGFRIAARARIVALLPDDAPSEWVDALLANAWAL